MRALATTIQSTLQVAGRNIDAMNDKLVQFEARHGVTDSKLKTAVVAVFAMLMANQAYAQLASTICKVYTSIFSNELISALAFVVFAILLGVMLLGDGTREKSSLIKFALVLAAMFNIPTILGYFGASPC